LKDIYPLKALFILGSIVTKSSIRALEYYRYLLNHQTFFLAMSESIVLPNSNAALPCPPIPKETQRPKDLHPTILTARIHPNTNEVVKQVNDYFLSNWPF
jgi:hypothetical protein